MKSYTPQVGDFVKVNDCYLVGFIASIGSIPFGRKRLPAAVLQCASRREVVTLDEITLVNRDGFRAEEVLA